MNALGFVDLHSHYVPAVDDGVRTIEEGVALCRELSALGYATVVATPHIRRGLFDNRRAGLEQAFAAFVDASVGESGLPELALSAEHHFDSLFWELQEEKGWLPYPGGRSLLIEFAYDAFPLGVEQQLFQLGLRGLSPLLAHPERYRPCFRRTTDLEPLLAQGLGAQLDVMSLTGHYGRAPRKAAERMLEEGVYVVACSDAHRPEDVREVAQAIALLYKRVGDDEALRLLSENPRRLLEGKKPWS